MKAVRMEWEGGSCCRPIQSISHCYGGLSNKQLYREDQLTKSVWWFSWRLNVTCLADLYSLYVDRKRSRSRSSKVIQVTHVKSITTQGLDTSLYVIIRTPIYYRASDRRPLLEPRALWSYIKHLNMNIFVQSALDIYPAEEYNTRDFSTVSFRWKPFVRSLLFVYRVSRKTRCAK